MELKQELDDFQQKYADLEQDAEQGSLTRHVYSQIVLNINLAQDRTPATQRAFETQMNLVKLAMHLNPPSERSVVWDAVKELEQIAELPHLPYVN